VITHAQNFEDVILARLFEGKERGFYVDIGAGHPSRLSVTKHFYDLGWHGINVEPIFNNWELFRRERPRDVNLNVAVASIPGATQFCETLDDNALSTLNSARIAQLAQTGVRTLTYTVECVTGDSILEEHGEPIDFLKIDVEGAEDDVLRSIDLERYKPGVLVIEAVAPLVFSGWSRFALDRAPAAAWEPRVLSHGYVPAYFDGLNQYYLRKDLSHLASRLELPPGVFDFIIPGLEEKFHRQQRETHAAMTASIAQKDSLIAALKGAAAVAESRQQQADLVQAQKEAVILELDAALEEVRQAAEERQAALARAEEAAKQSSERERALGAALIEKEAVIRELHKAVVAYRATFSVLGIFVKPLNGIVALARSAGRLPRNLLAPRLGVLNQHAPVEIRLPARYDRPVCVDPAPRISLVTPSYGQAGFIGRTLRSVFDQNYPNLEYFVQDGASGDGTVEILEQYNGHLAGWDSRPDSGQSEAINRGFERTTGEIMAWLNSDDMLLPGALATVADYFNRHPDIDVVYGHRLLIDENDRQVGRWMLPEHDNEVLSWADFVPQETLYWRRRIWDKAGGRIDQSFRFAMDWDLLIRFRDAGARFARLDRFIGAFRIHPHQKTSAVMGEVGFQEMNRIRKRVLGRVPSGTEVRKAVAPYIARHVMTDLAWRIRNRLESRS